MSTDSKNDSKDRSDRSDRNDNAGANRQSAQSGRYTDFPAASPESNVNPAGAPQTSHGSATGPIPGGTQGAARAGESLQSGMGGAAAGGNPGTSAGGAVVTPEDAAATADKGTSRRDD
jgi:hypothetical protein